jgi:N-alpha-acetyltransferase 10/11
VGYVLCKMDDERHKDPDEVPPNGHITSLAVLRSYRKLGLAAQLMAQANYAMHETYGSQYCSLHVRRSNRAALHLYRNTMGYEEKDLEVGYYADKEDAFAMRKDLGPPVGKWVQLEERRQARLKQKKEQALIGESDKDRKARLRKEKVEALNKNEEEETSSAAAAVTPESATDAAAAAAKPKSDFLAGTAANSQAKKKGGGGKKGKKKK